MFSINKKEKIFYALIKWSSLYRGKIRILYFCVHFLIYLHHQCSLQSYQSNLQFEPFHSFPFTSSGQCWCTYPNTASNKCLLVSNGICVMAGYLLSASDFSAAFPEIPLLVKSIKN